MIVLIWQRKLLTTFAGMFRSFAQMVKVAKPDATPRERKMIPYGVAIAAGTVWGVWWTVNQSIS